MRCLDGVTHWTELIDGRSEERLPSGDGGHRTGEGPSRQAEGQVILILCCRMSRRSAQRCGLIVPHAGE